MLLYEQSRARVAQLASARPSVPEVHSSISGDTWDSIESQNFFPPATLHLIYKALIQPHFDHCNVVLTIAMERRGVKLADKLHKP